MSYYTSNYSSPSEIASELESARDAIDSALSNIQDFEEADDSIAEEAANQAQQFKDEVIETVKKVNEMSSALLDFAEDDSDLYRVRKLATYVLELFESTDKQPYMSKYAAASKIMEAVYQLNEERKKAVWEYSNNKSAETQAE